MHNSQACYINLITGHEPLRMQGGILTTGIINSPTYADFPQHTLVVLQDTLTASSVMIEGSINRPTTGLNT